MIVEVKHPADVKVIACGGTFDMLPDTTPCQFSVPSLVLRIVDDHRIDGHIAFLAPFAKDSSYMTESDQQVIVKLIKDADEDRIVIVQGTDTLSETADTVRASQFDKTIVLTGSFVPALLVHSDAPGNLIGAIVAARLLPTGTYLAIQGDVILVGAFAKDTIRNRFIRCSSA
jgi:L-asparaginase